jgi:ComF family protein
VLVPVPLHFLRHWWRGYNQAEVLAGRLARHSRSARVVRAVSRIRFTPAQTQQTSASARRANVKGAFALMSPGEVAGRHVVVVDDVITSGGTISEVGRMLLHARPASLCAISLALADARGRQFKRI